MEVCIFDIKRFAVHDGPGIRVTVFFKGCPLACRWCHNPEGIPEGITSHAEQVEFDGVTLQRETKVGRWIETRDLVRQILCDRVFMEETGGGVTISGGEPLLQDKALLRILGYCRKEGIHTAVDTSGQASRRVMEKVARAADLILFDLKTMDEGKHRAFTGVSNAQILDNLDIALHSGSEVNLRIPLVPGFNDSAVEMGRILEYIGKCGRLNNVDILPYHEYAVHKYRKFNKKPMEIFRKPSESLIAETKKLFENAGYIVGEGG